MGETLSEAVKQSLLALGIDDNGRSCADIPEAACNEQPRNIWLHVASLTASKISDGLIDPKLVLSWLMVTLGAPVALIGLLVPIREAGALLPQLFTAGYIRRLPRRKWLWAGGSAVQGLCALAIAIISLTLKGKAAGLSILAALTVLALARSVCSVAYKDVLGKTVAKSRRGRTTGAAGSIAAMGVIIYALLLMFEIVPRLNLVTWGLFIAGGAWIVGALLFTQLIEEKGATEGGKSAITTALEDLSLLKTDAQLRQFIFTRGLLTATALAPPFMIALASESGSGGSFEKLGALVLASALAGLLSAFVWGRLSDSSSRKVLMASGAVSAAALLVTAGLSSAGALSHPAALPLVLFTLMIAYQGVRLGRSTHLVDMATAENRAAFTALSNTVIGVLLLMGGGFSLIASAFGTLPVIVIFAVMCALAVVSAFFLDEVQIP